MRDFLGGPNPTGTRIAIPFTGRAGGGVREVTYGTKGLSHTERGSIIIW